MRSTERRSRHRDADWHSLLDAAEAVFSRHGFATASMRDIAAEAGFSVGGLYQFVEGKDALYLAVVDQIWREYLDAVEPSVGQPDFEAQLLALTRGTLEFFQARRAFLSIYMVERHNFTGTFADRVSQTVARHKQARRALLLRILEGARRAQRLRTEDLDFVASAYLGLMVGLMLHCGADTVAPRAEDVVSLFCTGIVRSRRSSSK
jgi:AcrR family transcriptional regulator